MSLNTLPKFVVLAVLDGWGLARPGAGNAISLANTPNMNKFLASYPHTELAAAGESVGVPHGEAGNTETGHLNMGAGRIVYQDLARINMYIADGSFFTNPALLGAIEHAKKNNSNLHLLGLVGAGGVHSNLEHLFALIRLASAKKFERVFLHLFTDGRDSPPTSAKTYIGKVREVINKEKVGIIASIMGRYWAMDRDRRWERTAKAYFALTRGDGHLVKSPEEAIESSYEEGVTDEFITPSLITDGRGVPLIQVRNNDAIIFFNFRIDRPRQLARAFVLNDLTKRGMDFDFDPYLVKYAKKHVGDGFEHTPVFDRGPRLSNLCFVMMTEYEKLLVENDTKVAFPPETVVTTLGKVVSDAGKKQLRIAESEKERFVTYYFNGQTNLPYPGEERIIVPSPEVPTYDLKPEMSAVELTQTLLAKLRNANIYSFILVNFANPDMVGHTGNIGAAARACEVADECLGKIANHVLAYDGALLITADHGNCEEMIDQKTGQVETEHSANAVPFIAVYRGFEGNPTTLTSGILADVAPTILSLLGLPIPSSMTGRNLLGSLVV